MQQIKAQMEVNKAAADAAIAVDMTKLNDLNTLIQGARDQLTALAVLID